MSKIEWTNKTWNPVTGCNKVSRGCKHCYAEVMHRRLRGMFPEKYSKPFLGGVECHENELERPGQWTKPCMVFVNSMSDLFHEDVPFQFIASVFTAMTIYNQHTYQVLTKRPERLLLFYRWITFRQLYYPDSTVWVRDFAHHMGDHTLMLPQSWPLKNVWIGISCEDQKTADERIPLLLQVPAAIRFLSCEPLLGSIDLQKISMPSSCSNREINCLSTESFGYYHNRIDWVITGGESGHHARQMHLDWARSLRDQCAAANVPFFFKQWGKWLPENQCPNPGGSISRSELIDGVRYDAIGKGKWGNFIDNKKHLEFPTINNL